ncbi:hypothetical protein KC19_VG207300 [Ceratodon purpureus]|uniref:Uncharacterized protein n=1 Tax=Ceratodon purpureus TaxID=3225 RepID=A0A8T0HSM9_CERPU|nr:hypothetical protein KC19_VG207300 [Ceratodon purpureus]
MSSTLTRSVSICFILLSILPLSLAPADPVNFRTIETEAKAYKTPDTKHTSIATEDDCCGTLNKADQLQRSIDNRSPTLVPATTFFLPREHICYNNTNETSKYSNSITGRIHRSKVVKTWEKILSDQFTTTLKEETFSLASSVRSYSSNLSIQHLGGSKHFKKEMYSCKISAHLKWLENTDLKQHKGVVNTTEETLVTIMPQTENAADHISRLLATEQSNLSL